MHHLHSGMSRRHQVDYITFMYPPPPPCRSPPLVVPRGVGGEHTGATVHMPPGKCRTQDRAPTFAPTGALIFAVLQSLTPLLNPSSSIRLGQLPRVEGGSAFPFVTELSI